MTDPIRLKCAINRIHLPLKKPSIVYLALEILPPESASTHLPCAICLVVDRSGSMRGRKIRFAKEAASLLVDELQGMDYLALITFSDHVEVVAGIEQLADSKRAGLKERIAAIKTVGNTEMFKALEKALLELSMVGEERNDVVRRVILLSDGQPTDKISPSEYQHISSRLRAIGATVFCLGVGKDYNEDLLASIAESSSGIWRHVASAAEIPEVFSLQLDEARTVVRLMPWIHVHCQKGVEIQEVYEVSPVIQPIAGLERSQSYCAFSIRDVRVNEPQTYALKLRVAGCPRGTKKLATISIDNDPVSKIEVLADYTDVGKLLASESDAFPRGIFATAKTQVRTRIGLSGDDKALSDAERMKDTIIRDPSLSRITVIRQAADNMTETMLRAKSGLKGEALKQAKEGMTRIRRKES
jgi:Ca-activated chloride channel homolog